MELSDRSKILILFVLVGLVLYLLSGSGKSEPIHNEGMLTQDKITNPSKSNIIDTESDDSLPVDLDSNNRQKSENESEQPSVSKEMNKQERIKDRMLSQNSVRDGEYKHVSYNAGNRHAKSASLDKFFEGNCPQNQNENSGFSPSDDTGGKYASYMPTNKKGRVKLSEKDKFDAIGLLPQEKNGEWFDDPYSSTSVKSSHLINIYRPVGVNTISTTLKNPSHDIRGTPPNPKYPVSPWSNSSYEPDTNIRNESLCY
jgi:hypothetical protein